MSRGEEIVSVCFVYGSFVEKVRTSISQLAAGKLAAGGQAGGQAGKQRPGSGSPASPSQADV